MVEGAHLPNRSPPQENHVIPHLPPAPPQHREDYISPRVNQERTRDTCAMATRVQTPSCSYVWVSSASTKRGPGVLEHHGAGGVAGSPDLKLP